MTGLEGSVTKATTGAPPGLELLQLDAEGSLQPGTEGSSFGSPPCLSSGLS